jgi:hypothetical protein
MIINIIKIKFTINVKYFKVNNGANDKDIKEIKVNIQVMTK